MHTFWELIKFVKMTALWSFKSIIHIFYLSRLRETIKFDEVMDDWYTLILLISTIKRFFLSYVL
jgi:hypothetical protein